LAAYVLLADPAWMEASVSSYYDMVDTIVASYDMNGMSWSGVPIGHSIEECRRRLDAIDRDRKVVYLSDDYCSSSYDHLLDLETVQRQHALDLAGKDADWVVQLDADEILPDQDCLRRLIDEAGRRDCTGVRIPARWLFARLTSSLFLERSTRRGRTQRVMPGEIAVRSGAQLRLARAHEGDNVSATWTRPRDNSVRIKKSQGIVHLSTIRTHSEMVEKSVVSVHSRDFDWQAYLRSWEMAHEQPLRTMWRCWWDQTQPTYRLAYIRHVGQDGFLWAAR
jgi:hypothetical protein